MAGKTKTSALKKSSTQKKKGSGENISKKPAVKKKAASGKTTAKKKSGPKKGTAVKTSTKKKGGKKKGSASKTIVKKKASSLKTSVKKRAAPRKAAPKKSSVKKRVSVIKKPAQKKAPPEKPLFEAYKGIRPYIFTSYSHKNMKTVFRIIKKLHDKRYRIWYDEGIEPGNEWPEIVGNAIIKCSQFLVFMSPAAAVSRNVRNEINLAFNENKDILVVFLEKTRLSGGMKLQIGTVQFINIFELTEKNFFEKVTKVLDPKIGN